MESYRCSKCKNNYKFKETAILCCTDRNGCGKKDTPNSIITSQCGETITNGKWYFCKSCQMKK